MKSFISKSLGVLAALTVFAAPASAAKIMLRFSNGSNLIASMTVVANGDAPPPAVFQSEINDFSDLRYFNFTMLGQSYALKDVAPLNNYRHLHVSQYGYFYPELVCGSVGCGFFSIASAINQSRTNGFFISTGSIKEYRTGISLIYDNVSVVNALGTYVPEPAQWIMLIGGFAAIGSAARRRVSRAGRFSPLRT